MLTLSSTGENSAASLYLWELEIQCRIAAHAFACVNEEARIAVEGDHHSRRPRAKSPFELLANCSAFLSSFGIIAKILFAGVGAETTMRDNQNPVILRAATRAKALRELLKIDDLPALRSLAVRNAFEHIDERIDRLLRTQPSGSFVWLHLTHKAPPPGLVLKRFNPNTLTVSYLDDELDLAGCNSEVLQVREKLKGAFRRIRKDEALLSLRSSVCTAG